MEIKSINYLKSWWSDWTVYKQTIKIDHELMKKYNNRIRYLKNKVNKKIKKEHIFNDSDAKILYYTDTLKKWVNYLHLTWLYEFYRLIRKIWIDRKILDRNTIIIVK